ncbi:MAG: ATP-binding protein [Pseudomonadota bacterium]
MTVTSPAMIAKTHNPERQAERSFARTVMLLVVLGFGLVMFAGLAALGVMLRGEEQSRWLDHTYQVEREVSTIRLALEEMRSARRGFALRLRFDSASSYGDAARKLHTGIDRVSALTRDNPAQQRRIEELRRLANSLDSVFRASMNPGAQRSAQAEAERQQLAQKVENLATRMVDRERALLVERAQARDDSITLFYIVLFATGVLLALVAVGSIWVIRRYTGELVGSREELRSLNENLEDAVAIRTTDLQRANDEIQRFAYIVSHDLRSPLVNVMGFTAELEAAIGPLQGFVQEVARDKPELVTEDIRLAVEEDLPESVGFIRTSTHKMDRLINAILRLSREGRRTIVPEALDLDRLANGVIDNLRHRIDELGVTADIVPGMPRIVADRLALEQILSNLVENAVKYLKPGRPGEVSISATTAPGRVLISVADNGRGVDRRDHDRIFDLFRRSGEQDQPGEGIGLAHVRALAYRLGGTISVESELDKGSTFIVNLPAIYAGEKAALS